MAYFKKEVYPSIVYKSDAIEKLVEEGKQKFDHILILVPNVKDHEEIALLSKMLDSTLLVTRQDVTKKRDIFNSLVFFAEKKIPVSKTVILK